MDFCETMQLYLSLRLDGMLQPEEEQALEEHLAICPRCRALERELSAIHTALPELEEYEAPEGFARSVVDRVAALEEKPEVVPLFRRPQVRALMGLAACAVLCVGLYRGGLFDRTADGLLQADASGLDAAMYQDQETQTPAEADQAEPSAEQTMPRDAAPDAKNTQPDLATQSVPEDSETGAGSFDQADGVQEQPDVQLSQFQVSAAHNGVDCTVAGQAVSAVLTVDCLPEGWEEILGEAPEWLTDEEGRTCCIITAGQLQQLADLAGEQGVSAGVEGMAQEEQPCALVVLER